MVTLQNSTSLIMITHNHFCKNHDIDVYHNCCLISGSTSPWHTLTMNKPIFTFILALNFVPLVVATTTTVEPMVTTPYVQPTMEVNGTSTTNENLTTTHVEHTMDTTNVQEEMTTSVPPTMPTTNADDGSTDNTTELPESPDDALRGHHFPLDSHYSHPCCWNNKYVMFQEYTLWLFLGIW